MTLVFRDARAVCSVVALWLHCGCAMLLQALLSQAFANRMLQKQLFGEGLKTQALVLVIQHLTTEVEGAEGEACSLRAANLDLLNELQGRDAEVSSLQRGMEELRSSLALELNKEVALLLTLLLLILTLVLPPLRLTEQRPLHTNIDVNVQAASHTQKLEYVCFAT